MPELRVEVQPRSKYTVRDNGELKEVWGTTEVDIWCGDVRLYTWDIRPRYPWWSRVATHQGVAVVVEPSYAMMNSRIVKHYKYQFTMGLFQGYKLLVGMGLPFFGFHKAAIEQGWGDIIEDYIEQEAVDAVAFEDAQADKTRIAMEEL